jgi:hypothetical protein
MDTYTTIVFKYAVDDKAYLDLVDPGGGARIVCLAPGDSVIVTARAAAPRVYITEKGSDS